MQRRQALKRTLALLAAAVATPTALSLLNSCQSEVNTAQEVVDTFVFSTDQSSLIAEIAERIIPKTDNIPGAKDVGVPEFIELIVKDCFSLEKRALFAEGADAFEVACKAATQKSFAELSDEARDEFLTTQAQELVDSNAAEGDKPNPKIVFLSEMSGLTKEGFFTSKEIGTKVLIYDPIPGEYKGCIPLADVGGTWAL